MTHSMEEQLVLFRDACRELDELLPADRNEIVRDKKVQRLAERLLGIALEAMFDFLVVLAVGVSQTAVNRRMSIQKLLDGKWIDAPQAERLEELLESRNLLIHVYRRLTAEDVVALVGQVERAIPDLLDVARKISEKLQD